MSVTRRRVRLKVETASFASPDDVLASTTMQFWRGSGLRVEIGLFERGVLESVANMASLRLEIKAQATGGGAPAPADAALMAKEITLFDNTLNQATWDDGTKQHAVIEFTAAEANIAMPAQGRCWLILVGVTTVDSEPITLAAGVCEVKEDGWQLGSSTTPTPDTYYTDAQSDARYLNVATDGPHAKRGIVAIGSGEQTAAVAFVTAFAAPPSQVLITLEMPDGTGAILTPAVHTITAAGFTWLLSNPTPGTGYVLHWLAIV